MKKIENVVIVKHRWHVTILMEYEDGTKDELVATADALYTWGDGIWLGSKEEFEKIEDEYHSLSNDVILGPNTKDGTAEWPK